MPESHPPAPGPLVLPNLSAIEDAVRNVTFPISKRELMDQLDDEQTVIFDGRNVDLRTLVRDLHDDYFESEDEFRGLLEESYGMIADGAEVIIMPAPATGFPEPLQHRARGEVDRPSLPKDNA